MVTSREDIFRGALSLSEEDRADLIAALIESLVRKSKRASRKPGASRLSGARRSLSPALSRAFHGR